MPLPQGIANPKGAFGLALAGTLIGGQIAMTNDILTIELTNTTANALQYGTVVTFSDATGLNGGTTATANSLTVAGVIAQYGCNMISIAGTPTPAIPPGGNMMVIVRGVARVNIAANTVAANDVLASSTAAGVAVTNNALTAATVNAAVAIALEASGAKDGFNTVRARVVV
jgi:hypothetical protein